MKEEKMEEGRKEEWNGMEWKEWNGRNGIKETGDIEIFCRDDVPSIERLQTLAWQQEGRNPILAKQITIITQHSEGCKVIGISKAAPDAPQKIGRSNTSNGGDAPTLIFVSKSMYMRNHRSDKVSAIRSYT